MAVADFENNYLNGKLLVSTPSISDQSFFTKSVIYIVSHTSDGAIGIVVNQPLTKVSSSVIFNNFNIENNVDDLSIMLHFGGPIDSAKGFILHSSEYSKNILFSASPKISLSSNLEILKDIAIGKGPDKAMFVLGYSGWNNGQLEEEIENNNWLILPFSEDLIFSENNQNKWQDAYDIIGINQALYSNQIGHS